MTRPPFDDIPFPTDDPALCREAEASAARRSSGVAGAVPALSAEGAQGDLSGRAAKNEPRPRASGVRSETAPAPAASRAAPARDYFGSISTFRPERDRARPVPVAAPRNAPRSVSSAAPKSVPRFDAARFAAAYRRGDVLERDVRPAGEPALQATAPELSATLPAEETPVAVSAVLKYVDEAVRGFFTHCWIVGEVAQVTRSRLGHCYFSLKDEKGLLSCVLWRTRLAAAGMPQEGDRIEVRGELQVYGPNGRLQLSVDAWREAGRGALWAAFLALKAKLEAEGLFDAAKKRPLPVFPKRIAIVTSETAAARRDVEQTLERRMPWVERVLVHAAVQGAQAPASLVEALRRADGIGADVILLVRGGGAYEDLAAFNDETFARTLRDLKTPVVSGVGHETDFTIADFAADVRASTPTAAAEMVGRDGSYWFARLSKARETIERTIERELRTAEERFDRVDAVFPTGEGLLRTFDEKRLEAAARFARSFDLALVQKAQRVRTAGRMFQVPEAFFGGYDGRLALAASRLTCAFDEKLALGRREIDREKGRLDDMVFGRLARDGERLARAARLAPNPIPALERAERTVAVLKRTLEALDPDRPLRAGYARISTAAGVVGTAAAIAPGDVLRIDFADGALLARAQTRVPEAKRSSGSRTGASGSSETALDTNG